MVMNLSIHDFGINANAIPTDVEDLFKSFSKWRVNGLTKYYGSAYDFLVILYHLRFIEKLEASDIATRFGLQKEDVHLHLYAFGWNFSTDYGENKSIFEYKLTEWKEALARALIEAYSLDINEHVKLKEALNKSKRIQKRSYHDLKFTSVEEYTRVIYYLLNIENLSPINIMQLFNLSYSNIQYRLRAFGFNVGHEDGISGKKQRKSQNYGKTIRNSRKSRVNNQLRQFSPSASINEDYVRSQLSNFIYDYVDREKYEIIVGLSNTGILGSLEIDIPIMVYDVESNRVYRFAVEYNANFYHSQDRDSKKEALVVNKGWHYKAIIENRGSDIVIIRNYYNLL